jgi:ectoine hydroxylase
LLQPTPRAVFRVGCLGDCLVHGSRANLSPWDRRIFPLIVNPVSNAPTRFARPDCKHEGDFTPVTPLSDDGLLTAAPDRRT